MQESRRLGVALAREDARAARSSDGTQRSTVRQSEHLAQVSAAAAEAQAMLVQAYKGYITFQAKRLQSPNVRFEVRSCITH
jgi:hypothetical protein